MDVSKEMYNASCLYDWKENLNILQSLTSCWSLWSLWSCWSLWSAAYKNNWLKKISIGQPALEIDIAYLRAGDNNV